MRPRSSLPIVLAFVPLIATAAPGSQACTFAELVAQGRITVSGTGTGRHMGESITVDVRDLSDQGITTVIPAGWVFQAGDASVQNLLVVRNEPLTVPMGGSASVTCKAFCSEADDLGPPEGAVYLAGSMAAPKLVELAEFIAAGAYPDDAVLFAVWAVTGARPLSAVTSDEDADAVAALRQKVAELTGQTIPWYSVTYEGPQMDGHFSDAPTAVSGEFAFRMTNNGSVRIFITDAGGNAIREMGRERHLGPGNYAMEVALTVKGWRSGTYSIKAYEGEGNLLKRIDFEV